MKSEKANDHAWRNAIAGHVQDGQREEISDVIASIQSYLLLIANEELDRHLRNKVAPSDIVQNVLVKAQQNLDDFRGDSRDALLSWLRKILLNEVAIARRHYHAKLRDVQRETSRNSKVDLQDRKRSPASSVMWAEEVDVVRAALGQLSADHRTVVYLRMWQQLSFEQVGERMGRSAEAAKKLFQRAIRSLERELSE